MSKPLRLRERAGQFRLGVPNRTNLAKHRKPFSQTFRFESGNGGQTRRVELELKEEQTEVLIRFNKQD